MVDVTVERGVSVEQARVESSRSLSNKQDSRSPQVRSRVRINAEREIRIARPGDEQHIRPRFMQIFGDPTPWHEHAVRENRQRRRADGLLKTCRGRQRCSQSAARSMSQPAAKARKETARAGGRQIAVADAPGGRAEVVIAASRGGHPVWDGSPGLRFRDWR
jgi:hypothetical protein